MGSAARASLLVVVVAAACAVVVAATAGRSSGPPGLRVACPQKTFVVGFYPKGEPKQRKPHVRVYTKRQPLALVFPQQISFGSTCKSARDGKTVWGGGRSRLARGRVVLRCSVARKARFRAAAFIGPGGVYGGNKLQGTLGGTNKVFLAATLAKRGGTSTLRYAARYCKKR